MPKSPPKSQSSQESNQSSRPVTRSQAEKTTLLSPLKTAQRKKLEKLKLERLKLSRLKLDSEMEAMVVGVQDVKVEPFAFVIDKYRVQYIHEGRQLKPPQIPLCRLINMELVRPLQEQSAAIETLKVEFKKMGYLPDTPSFFVQLEDLEGKTQLVTDEIRDSWDPLWVEENRAFEEEIAQVAEFATLKDKMFSVLDGNHRLHSWMGLSKEYPMDKKYHPRVQCVILSCPKESMVEVEMAMHARNG